MNDCPLGCLEEGSDTAEIVNNLGSDVQCETGTMFCSSKFGDTFPVDPWSAGSHICDVVLESTLGCQFRATCLNVGLHPHQTFNGFDRGRSLGSAADREAHR